MTTDATRQLICTLALALAGTGFALAATTSEDTQFAPLDPLSGRLETSMAVYEFAPVRCGHYVEDGFDDVEIEGAGKTEEGENFHFSLSTTANDITIQLGTNSAFVSTDHSLHAAARDG